MQLDQAQKNKVAAWIAEGRQLSEVQKLLESEFGLRLTYLDLRLVIADLNLTPKDQQRAPAPSTNVVGPEAGQKTPPGAAKASDLTGPEPEKEAGEVSVTVDTVARPGTIVSGSVNFSDGNRATWYLDQMGRLGLMPEQEGYRPSQEDLQAFQMQLQQELQSLGL